MASSLESVSLGPVPRRSQKRRESVEIANPAKRIRVLSDDRIESYNLREFTKSQVKKRLKEEFEACQKSMKESNKRRDNSSWDKVKLISGFSPSTTDYGSVGVAFDRGRRTYMEDNHLVTTLRIQVRDRFYSIPLYGVFDGHGGKRCSEFLIQNLPARIQEGLKKIFVKKERQQPLYNFLRTIFVHLGRDFEKIFPLEGSTAAIALIVERKLLVVNVGDSRVILCSRKKTVALSADAKLDDERFRKEVLIRGGSTYQQSGITRLKKGDYSGLNMASAVGHPEVESAMNPCAEIVEINLDELDEHDRVILATDGVWDEGTSKAVSKFNRKLVKAGESSVKIASSIVEVAIAKKSHDNCTAIIVDIFKEKQRAASGNSLKFPISVPSSGTIP